MDPKFAKWLARIDAIIAAKIGLSYKDLADAPFADWFDDGFTPSQAAKILLADL